MRSLAYEQQYKIKARGGGPSNGRLERHPEAEREARPEVDAIEAPGPFLAVAEVRLTAVGGNGSGHWEHRINAHPEGFEAECTDKPHPRRADPSG
jgi:hypothetical protein